MALSQKTKGVIIALLFIAILLAPVCFALFHERFGNHTEVKPAPAPVSVPAGK